MKNRKLLALFLALFMLFGLVACDTAAPKEEAPADTPAEEAEAPAEEPAGEIDMTGPADAALEDWTIFDKLIADIKSETDFVKREALMHEAEDILMDTGALVPLYYYNDNYMKKPEVEGMYSTVTGFKFFMFATNGDNNILRLNISSEPDRLDPALNSTVDGAVLACNSFSGLFTYNDKGELIPDLVDTYEMSEDGLTYNLTLKDGLKWSNGDPLDANDFVYSWKRAAATETAADYSYMFDQIAGFPDDLQVSASEDGKVFTVNLIAPCAYFFDLCAFPTFFPVHQASVEGADGYMKDGEIMDPGAWALEAGFVSNGAYTLKEWNHRESMVYVKNPNYHRADEVKLEELHFMLSDDLATIYNAYKAGDLDFIDGVPSDEMDAAKESPEFFLVDNLGTYYACFNVKNQELFGDKTPQQAKAMRKAFSVLIDREYIIDTVAKAGQLPAASFIPEGMADGHGGLFRENDADYTFPFPDDKGYYSLKPDPDLAREYLKFAGFKFTDDGLLDPSTPLTLNYIANDLESHVKIAECIQQDLAELGIEMIIKTMAWDTFLNERKAGNFGLARNGWVADFNDPINMLEMWTTDSGNNDCQFGK